jgi:hypothetical protein
MSSGVIYVATGDRYIEEAKFSAKSLKENNRIQVTVFSDRDIESKYIDNVKSIDDHRYGILTPSMLEYDRTFLLDSDTYITENISEIFELLDKFDIAAPQSKTRTPELSERPTHRFEYVSEDVPDAFPIYSTGILAIKDNNRCREFLKNWNKLYDSYNDTADVADIEPAFRETVYKSDLRIATLPREYCFWPRDPGYLNGPAKITHGEFHNVKDIKYFSEHINKNLGMRVHTNERYPVKIRVKQGPTIKYRIQRTLHARGITESIKHIPSILKRLVT